MSKEKVGLAPGDVSEKWGRRMKGATGDIAKGIDAMTVNPMEEAANHQEKMLANLTAKVQDGTWASQLRKGSVADWKTNTKKKVAERMAGGVDAAMPKRKAFDQYLVNTLNAILPEVKAMPDMTFEDSMARVRRTCEHMKDNPYKGRS